ncbi:uncharacterized protein [Eucyclogobius newberryi]|uniref:uncharacterized protein isoform X2 n=1 Tax=Eucyclogobius newberryi TaxID=166745 RepID=UPI003B5B3AFA
MERRQREADGATGGRKNERLCSREERKRRKTTTATITTAAMAGDEGHHRPTNPHWPLGDEQDGRSSAASGLDVADRLTYLEQRMQMQEDEIQLLKMALADVLKRLNITEEHQASASSAATATGRRAGAKARPVSLALPSRSTTIKKSSTAPSSGAGRTYSPTPSSSVRSPPGSVKDSPCKARTRPSSAASSCKKSDQESAKPKEAAVALGTRRVTHCKVTMQIYLSPLAKKTGCSDVAKTATTVTTKTNPPNAPKTRSGTGSNGTKAEKKKSNPSFTLNLQKTSTSVSNSAPQETSSYQSPVKSPSQYFQICY